MPRYLTMTDELADYVRDAGTRETETQRELRAATVGHPGAMMQIGPDQGQVMAFLVRLIGARRASEIGTFTGYSALSVAAALPADGQLIACDVSDEYTSIGRPFWDKAGVAARIDLRLGAGAGDARRALVARRGRSLRLRLHRRRQAQLRRLLRAVPEARAQAAG